MSTIGNAETGRFVLSPDKVKILAGVLAIEPDQILQIEPVEKAAGRTLSVREGPLYANKEPLEVEFSKEAASLRDAVLEAMNTFQRNHNLSFSEMLKITGEISIPASREQLDEVTARMVRAAQAMRKTEDQRP